jgi:hypothetical protein
LDKNDEEYLKLLEYRKDNSTWTREFTDFVTNHDRRQLPRCKICDIMMEEKKKWKRFQEGDTDIYGIASGGLLPDLSCEKKPRFRKKF